MNDSPTPSCGATDLYPLLFEHNLMEKVWGGHQLRALKGLPPDGRPIGESWEVSALPGHESIVAEGPLAGHTLPGLVDAYGAALVGGRCLERFQGRFPLLVKLIDAGQDLSVQVHPGDRIAWQRHGQPGKSEMWYVLDAPPGSTLYCGFRRHITPCEYERRVQDGSLCEVLDELPAGQGDVFYVPAGRVHAIRAGLLLVEIQESSDITYRLYDYDRPGLDGHPRPLHTGLARDVINFTPASDGRVRYEPKMNARVRLVQGPRFAVNYFHVTRPFRRPLLHCDTFIIYICLEGNCCVATPAGEHVHLRRGQTCLVPAALADVRLIPEGRSHTSRLLEVVSPSDAHLLTEF